MIRRFPDATGPCPSQDGERTCRLDNGHGGTCDFALYCVLCRDAGKLAPATCFTTHSSGRWLYCDVCGADRCGGPNDGRIGIDDATEEPACRTGWPERTKESICHTEPEPSSSRNEPRGDAESVGTDGGPSSSSTTAPAVALGGATADTCAKVDTAESLTKEWQPLADRWPYRNETFSAAHWIEQGLRVGSGISVREAQCKFGASEDLVARTLAFLTNDDTIESLAALWASRGATHLTCAGWIAGHIDGKEGQQSIRDYGLLVQAPEDLVRRTQAFVANKRTPRVLPEFHAPAKHVGEPGVAVGGDDPLVEKVERQRKELARLNVVVQWQRDELVRVGAAPLDAIKAPRRAGTAKGSLWMAKDFDDDFDDDIVAERDAAVHWREHHEALLSRLGEILDQPADGPTLEEWAKTVVARVVKLKAALTKIVDDIDSNDIDSNDPTLIAIGNIADKALDEDACHTEPQRPSLNTIDFRGYAVSDGTDCYLWLFEHDPRRYRDLWRCGDCGVELWGD